MVLTNISPLLFSSGLADTFYLLMPPKAKSNHNISRQNHNSNPTQNSTTLSITFHQSGKLLKTRERKLATCELPLHQAYNSPNSPNNPNTTLRPIWVNLTTFDENNNPSSPSSPGKIRVKLALTKHVCFPANKGKMTFEPSFNENYRLFTQQV